MNREGYHFVRINGNCAVANISNERKDTYMVVITYGEGSRTECFLHNKTNIHKDIKEKVITISETLAVKETRDAYCFKNGIIADCIEIEVDRMCRFEVVYENERNDKCSIVMKDSLFALTTPVLVDSIVNGALEIAYNLGFNRYVSTELVCVVLL